MTACAILALTLSMEPHALPDARMADVTLRLRFTNACPIDVQIYPATAQMDSVAGWESTQWHVQVMKPKSIHLQALRTWYGPPDEPPGENHYLENMLTVAAGGNVESEIRACWIPNRLLKPESLARETLDPEGMDKLEFATKEASVLILNQDCAEVRKRQAASPTDFLRPGVLLFVPPTRLIEFSVGYSQKKWVGFSPAHELNLKSNSVEVKIGH